MSSPQTESFPCVACGENANLRCSACHKTHYCTRTCQKENWKIHRMYCSEIASTFGHMMCHRLLSAQSKAHSIPICVFHGDPLKCDSKVSFGQLGVFCDTNQFNRIAEQSHCFREDEDKSSSFTIVEEELFPMIGWGTKELFDGSLTNPERKPLTKECLGKYCYAISWNDASKKTTNSCTVKEFSEYAQIRFLVGMAISEAGETGTLHIPVNSRAARFIVEDQSEIKKTEMSNGVYKVFGTGNLLERDEEDEFISNFSSKLSVGTD